MAHTNGEPGMKRLEETVSQVKQVVSASLRPLPTQTGDGTYIADKSPTGLVQDIRHMDPKDIDTILDAVKDAITGSSIDDRDYLMERVIQVCYPSL